MEDTGVKVYKPKIAKQELMPCLIFLHGGGWTLGSAGEICVGFLTQTFLLVKLSQTHSGN